MWSVGFVIFIVSIVLTIHAMNKENIKAMWAFISIMWLGIIIMNLSK